MKFTTLHLIFASYMVTARAFMTSANNIKSLAFHRSSTPFVRATESIIRSMATAPIDFAKNEIAANQVTIFSKTYCPYCTATKALFSDLKIPTKIHELDTMENGAAIQSALLELTGQRTVPNVFINGKHLGGNDKTQAAHKSGLLAEMLANK